MSDGCVLKEGSATSSKSRQAVPGQREMIGRLSTMRGFHSTEKAMTDDRETAHRWEPVGDLPLAACQVWRLKSDNNFELTVEGDFGTSERTLKIDFQGVVALAAHDDMLGLTKIRADTSIPLIGSGRQASYRWPILRVENSHWLRSTLGPTEDCTHFLLLSLECTVEVIAREATPSWI
ncbi:hypothetical protein X770_13400 [Mesorhizobium sp. LSJC269B00]|nr:hypothetical protein X770_13400 [Mesorhizobium sp. LSJC269B00]